jgi:deazaflavin-dependent oxidoreductase (nitroreductase family)
VNRIVRGVLRTPLLCRLAGKRLLTLYVVGHKTGRQYQIPVAYCRADGHLLVGTQFGWVRNLNSGEPVQIRLLGQLRSADVVVLREETEVVAQLTRMADDNHQFAKFNKIGFDAGGRPRSEDLHLAWIAGARVAVLTPRPA